MRLSGTAITCHKKERGRQLLGNDEADADGVGPSQRDDPHASLACAATSAEPVEPEQSKDPRLVPGHAAGPSSVMGCVTERLKGVL